MKGMRNTVAMTFAGVPPGDTIGNRLKQLREHANLTRKQFADKTGLDEHQVYRFETQGQLATKDEFPSCDAVARLFCVQPVWLYAGSMAPEKLWPDWWRP